MIDRTRQGRPAKYPWRTMAVGDSFLFHGDQAAASSRAVTAGKRTGRTFATETTNEGVRITRTA